MKRLQLVAILLLSIIACKKEKETNNPDINDVNLNIKVAAVYPTLFNSVDVNIDGEIVQDFQFVITHSDDDPNQHTIDLRVYDNKYQFLVEMVSDAFVIKNINKGSSIQPNLNIWKNGHIFLRHLLSNGTDYGYSDIGDFYVGFRKQNSQGGYQYGWMKINIINGETLEIKEYALHKIADTPINAGEK